jgi:phosphate transport system substrate-binding protein
VDTGGATNWPIVSTSFVLLPKNPADAARLAAVMRFFDWTYRNGGASAEHLGYVVLPVAVQDGVRDAWRIQVLYDGKPVYN